MCVYVGIDVHRKRSQIAIAGEDGKVAVNRNVANGGEAMRRLIGALPAGTPVAFEAAYGWGWLAALLERHGLEPHMVHPYLVARGPMRMPRFAGDLPIISDVMDVNTRINIRGMIAAIRTNSPGLFGDGAIGATAINKGLSVITADRNFRTILEQFGVEVRVP